MPRLAHHLLDVFTDRPFTGNPLAVFIDPPELSTAQMQALAGELNLSESVFVHTPTADGDPWPTRIFTPSAELPFAGHPTVGTAVLLATLGLVDTSVVLAEGVGDVAVSIERNGDRTSATLRTAQAPAYSVAPERDRLARVLSLSTDQLHPSLAEGIWSCGVPFCIVPVRDADALARIRIDLAQWSEHLEHSDGASIYAMAPLDEDLHRWRARSFAPGLGIPEDPATGSAAAAAAGLLAASRQLRKGPMRWTIEQGVEMGRPSELRVALDLDGNEASAVLVGGDAVVVGSGELEVPSAP